MVVNDSNETRRAGDAAGLNDDAFPGGNCNSSNATKPLHVQARIANTQRDLVFEALRIAGVKALHAADDIALGDDECAERGIRIAIHYLKEAASGFRALEQIDAAIASLTGEVSP
jgi:hypothetical protein